jgi:hypothetical protein
MWGVNFKLLGQILHPLVNLNLPLSNILPKIFLCPRRHL